VTDLPVPPVTEAYQKAHKNYVLFSALLASWQLIGITLETKERWGISFKSPNAVPLMLIALMVYFGYKTTIEWYQCEPSRREHLAALIDYRIGHSIAIIALMIAAFQYVVRAQLVDVVARHVPELSIWLGLLVFADVLLSMAIKARRSKKLPWKGMFWALLVFLAMTVLTVVEFLKHGSYLALPITALLSFVLSVWMVRVALKSPIASLKVDRIEFVGTQKNEPQS
jgi:hypothetical protein